MIKIVNLNKSYRDREVLKDLNLEINRGEIIGLLSPNAEGKSTLLRILGGQITYDSGDYFFNGEEFFHKNKEVIGYMNDTSIIPLGWKVKDGIDNYKEYFSTFDEAKAIEMLRYFKIDLNKRVKSLSKGENEKYHLSLALSIDAQLYILDEPLAAIDLIAREEVISMILDNFNIESTIIISSHLVSDIERMLDRVLLLKDGKIIRNELVEDLRAEGKSVVDLYKAVYGNVQG